jgi:hypothetical protein
MHTEDKWYDGIPEGRLNLYDKIFLLAMLNYKQGRYRYFDDFYNGLKKKFKIHPSELENQMTRYLRLWHSVKLNASGKIKTSKADYDLDSIEALAIQRKISVYVYHILVEAKLFSKDEILNYYSKYGTFIEMKRCGVKTNRFLIEICNEWSDLL